MKAVRFTIKMLFLCAVFLFINLNSGCKNPDEFSPPQDSLVAPPAPPQLITPPDSTFFYLIPVDIFFEWSSIADAEYYEIEFSNDTTFTTAGKFTVYTNSFAISFTQFGTYFWRVRTYSPLWTWFTNWSEIRYFRISTTP